MSVRPTTRIRIAPVTPLIGAEISGVDLSSPLDPATVQELRAAWLAWKVLFFRDQPMTADQQIAFGCCFGEVTPAHPISPGMADHPEVWERAAADYKGLHLKDTSVPTAEPPRDYAGWHIDITFVANPAMGSILRGVEIPDYGGDTLWCNLAAAYEGLSSKIRGLIDELQAVHVSDVYDLPSSRSTERVAGRFAAVHPLVRVHPETGQKSIFVNPGTTTHIVGLKERESTMLLNLLADEIKRPEYQVRFRWTPNSVAFWDNRVTAHVGPVDFAYFDAKRVVQRITLAGDIPVGPNGFRSQSLEGDLFH